MSLTISSWLNCALQDDEAVYWVSIWENNWLDGCVSLITSPLGPYKIIKHFLSNYLSHVPFSKIHLSRRAILKFQYCFESYLYGQWRPREHCFIALLLQIVSLHQMRPTQMLIHYNFSAEWAIQSFMLALCILFTDGTYEAHLAYDIFPNGSHRGTFWNLQPLKWTKFHNANI